eukprot:g599.t1
MKKALGKPIAEAENALKEQAKELQEKVAQVMAASLEHVIKARGRGRMMLADLRERRENLEMSVTSVSEAADVDSCVNDIKQLAQVWEGLIEGLIAKVDDLHKKAEGGVVKGGATAAFEVAKISGGAVKELSALVKSLADMKKSVPNTGTMKEALGKAIAEAENALKEQAKELQEKVAQVMAASLEHVIK